MFTYLYSVNNDKQNKKQNIMNTFSTLLFAAQITLFAAFLFSAARLVHALITNK